MKYAKVTLVKKPQAFGDEGKTEVIEWPEGLTLPRANDGIKGEKLEGIVLYTDFDLKTREVTIYLKG